MIQLSMSDNSFNEEDVNAVEVALGTINYCTCCD